MVYARQEEITVHFNGAITMILDGEEFIPLETDGSYLIPVIYNGPYISSGKGIVRCSEIIG